MNAVKTNTWAALASLLAVLAVATVFRVPGLESRPFHGDEANQAVKAGILLDEGHYVYDPHEHHGPTLYYAALPILAFNASDFESTQMWMYRLVPVLFSLLGIAALWLLREPLGWSGILWAGLLLAISNAQVFYSRYFIQESLFVTFALLAIGAGYRYASRSGWYWAVACGTSLGLIHATKETSILLYGAMGVGLIGVLVTRRSERDTLVDYVRKSGWKHGLALTAAALVVIIVLFSAFFTHGRGPLDSILTYFNYADRAEGEGSTALHDHPWHYYWSLLAYTYREAGPRWTEAFGLALGGLGIVLALLGRVSREPLSRDLLRFLALYTLALAVVYSLIPYKTPWNVLPFWTPWLVLGGVGAAWLIRITPTRVGKALLLLALIAGLAHARWLTHQGNVVYAADTRNPWVYAHTSTAINRLGDRIEDLAALHPDGRSLHINILKPDADYWPLPWYLRQYDTVGYWTTPPENPHAAIIVTDTALRGYMEQFDVDERYQFEFHALRPNVKLHVYIERSLWDALMSSRQ